MQLKNYQQQALEQLDRWLDALKKARSNAEKAGEVLEKQDIPVPEELKNYPLAAWGNLQEQNVHPDYISRTATSGEPIPHACLKVPTGGGKTLLGVAALERIKQDTGFVLWIVPTRAIYDQTIKAFRTREHPYRQMLERISGGKVKLLQKNDRFTKQDTESQLCVMMLMLPSANRQKGKDFLKIFRDSGDYTSFFPEQDDAKANAMLSEQCPDLETSKDGNWVKQSLVNVLKLIRPTVILDEAHKAYGPNDAKNTEFVRSINRLNPRLVLELSATPKVGISNILVNISGVELQAEEMIKLPIEIQSLSNSDWKRTLTEAHGKLGLLEVQAGKVKTRENRYIRPIALVRVQRTGKGQRQPGYIHSEDAQDYLIHNLAVPAEHIRIHSSQQKELAGEDLLSEMSRVRWIITKDALKEGWDCSFAYVLVLLDNTTATTAMTQMVGRVMRQPHARRVAECEALNRCYIYCYNQDVGRAIDGVKAGLEAEGLTGLRGYVRGGDEAGMGKPTTVRWRNKYRKTRIFLPQVLHKEGRGWRPIDYDRDILGAVNWSATRAGKMVNLDDGEAAGRQIAVVDIQSETTAVEAGAVTGEALSLDYFVRRLVDLVPNPWQAMRIVENFIRQHRKAGYQDSRLLNNRIHLSDELNRHVKADIDRKAEAIFCDKLGRNEIRLHLKTDRQLNYELEKSFEVFVSANERALQGEHALPIQRSLFDPVFEGDFNGLEKEFALYLDTQDAIYWWHRIAARQAYFLQGWRRDRVYPDFVACRQDNGTLLILETKGDHLAGNQDTEYKRKLLETLEKTYKSAIDRGELEVRHPPAKFRIMFEDSWQTDLNGLVSETR